MPAFTASAPGKIILFGEHAVVYGQPAIAAPVIDVRATAIVKARPGGIGINLIAPDIDLSGGLADLPLDDAIALAARLTFEEIGVTDPPACTLAISSSIPVAAGLGSGAAVSVAIIRALSAFLGHPLPDKTVNQITFEVEKLHHGTPSGIDNTVVTYCKPVHYTKGQPIETIDIPIPFSIVIGDTGVYSPTVKTVSQVREAYQAEPDLYQNYFNLCGTIVQNALFQISDRRNASLGPLMGDNHGILRKMGVSSPELDTLVEAARDAGALGAKLSGGGRGGNMIALVEADTAEQVAGALSKAGAVRTIITTIK